ncbi:MAG: hypothetical protein ACK4SZ_05310 [Allosphingosinicella sp.]|uniref:hypothetical protein n=1 Tax=Allosphingosinicella sp. TaxID=2823234 RepID=UPI00392D45C1
MIAYGLIAAIVLGAFIALWLSVLRHRFAFQQRRRRFYRDRRRAAANSSDRASPAIEAD